MKIEERVKNYNKDEILFAKDEYIKIVICLTITIILVILFNFLIAAIYKPDIEMLIKGLQGKVSSERFNFLSPEPVENLQFVLSILFTTLSLFGLWYFLKKKLKIKYINVLYHIIAFISIMGFAIVIYFIFKVNNFFYFFFVDFKLSLMVFPILVILIYFEDKLFIKIPLRIILYAVTAILFIGVFFSCIFHVTLYPGWVAHINALIYYFNEVLGGKSLLVDMTGLYGFQPHFLEPIFRIIGLKDFSFQIVMGCLLCSGYFFLYLFLNKSLRSRTIALLGLISTIMIQYFGWRLLRGLDMTEPYFQYHPLRSFFPLLSLYLVSLYLSNNSKKLYYTIAIIASISVLWNKDTGIIILFAWIAMLCFTEISNGLSKISIKRCIYHIIVNGIFFMSIFIIFTLYIYIRSGTLPNYNSVLMFQLFFSKFGYFAMPMIPFHPWNLVLFIYLIGILYSIRSLINKDDSNRARTIFYVSVLGIGIFLYFQGRSHDYNLIHTVYPAMILVTIFSDDLLIAIKQIGMRVYTQVTYFCILFFLITSLFVAFVGNPAVVYSYFDTKLKSFFAPIKNEVMVNIEFIKNNTVKGEHILVISENMEGIYYTCSDTFSALNIESTTDWFFVSQYSKFSNFLKNNLSCKIFFCNDNSAISKTALSILSTQYKPIKLAQNNKMVLYEKLK